jgi:hypothetical protein
MGAGYALPERCCCCCCCRLLQVMKWLAESGPELLTELRAAEAAYNRSGLVQQSVFNSQECVFC